MILKDEQHKIGAVELWTFRIECDKCHGTVCATMPTREETQRFVYDLGWRVNSRARKYIHLCRRCGTKGCPKGQQVSEILLEITHTNGS